MPSLSGIDLAVEVRKARTGCRILLISGHINTAVLLEDAHRQGHVFEVHTKPISPQKLISMVSKLR